MTEGRGKVRRERKKKPAFTYAKPYKNSVIQFNYTSVYHVEIIFLCATKKTVNL